MKICALAAACLLALFSVEAVSASQDSAVDDWKALETGVRDGTIAKDEASQQLASAVVELMTHCETTYVFTDGWIFPLRKYPHAVIYRKDFQPDSVYGPEKIKGYDFFDGNRHGGHPAYDIFIKDKNFDSCDDASGMPVEVVSVTDAMVISVNTGWKKGDKLRGGNYVWTFSPSGHRFFYYAHLNSVYTSPGRFLRKGGLIGTVGRTGVLAAKKISPTHLHLMVIEYKDGNMIPFDYYREIIK